MSNTRLVLLVETAIMAGLAYVLGLIQINFGWAYGGSISFVMVPIVILALRRGMLAGVTAGLLVGLLKMMIGGSVVHPIQAILDYPLAFLVLGLAGLVKISPALSKNKIMTLSVVGIVIATALRFVCHFLSGVVFFAEYAPEGTPVAVYSAIYNASYLVPEAIITAVAVVFIAVGAPQLFKPRASVSIGNRNERYVIVTGGNLSDWDLERIGSDDKVIAVDYGLEWCLKHHITPHFAIGDFDSISSDLVSKLEQLAIEVVILRQEKDETDTEAALIWTLSKKPSELIILGGLGSRMDHTLANIHLLRLAVHANIRCQILNEHNAIQIITSHCTIKHEHYQYLSLLPLTEEVKGVTLTGFKYPLNKATLVIGKTIGISNEWLSEEGHIELDSGELLVIRSKD